MGKTCAELFKGLDGTIIGNQEELVTGLAFRSDKVVPGDVFFCIVGTVVDGHTFAQDAIDRGAKVLVVERKLYLVDTSDVTLVVVDDTRRAMAQAASRYYGNPSRFMQLVGVTGTNGKTTTTFLVESMVKAAQKKCGIIGTTGNLIDGRMEEAAHTTPESPDLQELFARMRDVETDVVAIEVSSHALDLKRTFATTFAVTSFTNLTQDHLDYHHTFEAYFEAKAKLFSSDYPAKRVISVDDKWGVALAQRCVDAGDHVITFGFDESADIHPTKVDYSSTQTKVELAVCGREYAFTYPLVGRFNVSNIMNAFGIGMCLGLDSDTIIRGLSTAPGIPGRLQRVASEHSNGVDVFVDYAHTPDALDKALASIMALNPRRTLVVFGCGGDRDATKRSIMGKVALVADYVIVTSDNPRTEDPNAIIRDIVSGMEAGKDHYEVVADRRDAIARAIELAQPGDAVLVAGKGHEDYQIIGHVKVHFDDREVVAEEFARAAKARA
ncbi:MAG: UDP-N-acetylmuramoyl-L-alanyl-D-glutamate--2,6-diaminopimelate ligase [Coriobacteriia bacterium]|nr:UDP-N-acetylmuramoyl-L-alanyl-D-glutamate--2,6-diaminopimelate ligase [Coriobacteriia bacterium]